MKYLSHYVEAQQTALFDTTGSFFAFSKKQLDEKVVEGTRYTSLGAGLICPSANVEELEKGLETIQTDGIAADIAENGKAAIIQRELANHEAQITGCLRDTADSLDGYDISDAAIEAGYVLFYRECEKNDWF